MRSKFQGNFEIVRLYDENNPRPPVTKVGVLPFMREAGQGITILLMKPKAEAKHLGAPAFQLPKGTRRLFINDRWCDMREDDLRHADESFWEPLVDTALREGEEEVGLKHSNIRQLFDMGVFEFVSASRGIRKPLHMFAAELLTRDDFGPFEASTLETKWMTPEEFAGAGRPDHIAILNAITGRLLAEK